MRFVIVLESTNPQKREKKKKEEISNQFVFQSQKWIYIWSNYEGEKKKKKNSLFVLPKTEKTNSSI